MPIPSRSLYELSLALRRSGVDISKLSHTDMLRQYVAPYLKAAGEGNEGAAMVKANMELVKAMTPQRRIGLAEDISKIDYSGINPSLDYSLGDHYHERVKRSRNHRGLYWQKPDYGIVGYGRSLPNHAQEKIAGLIMPYRYIDLSNPEYNKRLSSNYKKLMGMDIGYSGVEGLGNILDIDIYDLNDYLYNEFAYNTARRKFLNHEKETVKAVQDYARENGLKNLDGTPWVPSAEDIMRTTFTFGNGIAGPGIRKREIRPSSQRYLEWVPKFGKDVQVDPVMNDYRFFQFRDYNGDIWTSSNPAYIQRYTDHPFSVWKTYHSGENMLTAPRLPMINLGYTYKNLPFVFNKEKRILEFHPDFKLNLTEQYKEPDPILGEGFPKPGDPEEGTYIQQFKNGDPERTSKAWGGPTEMTADDLLQISKENGFSGIIIPDFYGNQTWRVYNPGEELIKAPSWEPAWVTAYKMTKHKKGGKLIPKGQEGLGKWFLRQLRRLVPAITGTVKETEKVAKKSEAASNLQKGVQRAQKISKSAQFKELINGLELDDRVSQELISRYNGLDPTTQSTERKMLLRLMKNNQIHSIADFDLVVDKVHSNKMGGNPNILGIETISDLDTPFAESWNRKQKEKQEYDRALGTFTKIYDYPEINYTAYEVPATRQGQQDLLTVMKGQYNKKIQPWCVIETDKKTGELTPAAIERWDKEYAGPKFALMDKKGKIRYFMSGNSGWFDMNDKRTEAIREFKPTIQIGNGPGYRMFKLPELHSYETVNPDKRHFYLDWKTPLSANISKDLSNGTRIDKTLSGYTIHHRGPHDPKTSVFLYRDSSPSVRHYESGPLPGLIGNWYKTQSGKSRFVLDSFIPHAYTILDESGNVLKDKIKNNSLLFHNNMMLMQNGKDARLFRGKNQESLLKFALNGEDLDTGYAETLFGVTPLYEQFGTRHGINSWDLSDSGKDATNLPSALKKFGFQLPELKKGGVLKGQGSVKLGLKEIGREIREIIKESQNVARGILTKTQLSGIKDMAEVATTHPQKVWKSVPLYLRGINQNENITDQKDFIADNFGLFNKFYKGLYKFKFGKTSEEEAKSGLNHLYANNGILQFNLNQRAQFAKNNGYLLDISKLIGDVRNTPQTFHYFPFNAYSNRIDKNNLGWFNNTTGVHINTANTRRYNTTSSTAIHENEHALQNAVADEIMDQNWYQDKSTGVWHKKKDLGNFEYTNYFPEEQQLLDDIYHTYQIGLSDWIKETYRDSRNYPYKSGDHASPLEQGATNTEVKYIYANDYGVDFSKLKDYTELPDLIWIDGGGNLVRDPLRRIPSKYATIYQDNLQSNINEEIKQWKNNNEHNFTKEDLNEFISGLNRKYNDALKKAVFYVGGLTGAAYLGTGLNNQQNNQR